MADILALISKLSVRHVLKNAPVDYREGFARAASNTYPANEWYEAWCFAEWMGLKLPTEAQWEKAARGESLKIRPATISSDPKPYWFDGKEDELMNVAWFRENSGGDTKEVDKPPSKYAEFRHPFELDGLGGNVWEWCMDAQGFKYTEDDRKDPEACKENPDEVITNRMIRGGSFDSPAWNCRHAVRQHT